MGSCVCKDKIEDRHGSAHRVPYNRGHSLHQRNSPSSTSPVNEAANSRVQHAVLETLHLIRTLVDPEGEPIQAMLILQQIGETESGWLDVVIGLIVHIPMDEPLGPAVIDLLLDECPLPTKDGIMKLYTRLKHDPSGGDFMRFHSECQQRNTCIVLGCLAAKLAGPTSVAILTTEVLNYLISRLSLSFHPVINLHALIALEKFAQTSENKRTIENIIKSLPRNPFEVLELDTKPVTYPKIEVRFCASWCQDNLFIPEGRKFAYEKVNLKNINAMLNINDVSEYLKISADGLRSRSDASSFESVRCTFQVDSGVWYYEVYITTAGVMQIGWATKDSSFLNHEGQGIGDDEYSMAYDGCRQLIWFKAESRPIHQKCWSPGDTLGLLLNIDEKYLSFSLNGECLPSYDDLFQYSSGGYFAAASFMSYQQCEFNFGAKPFKYPPKGTLFKTFNDYGTMTDEEKKILPRHMRLNLIKNFQVNEDSCTICFAEKASHKLVPCEHGGFCFKCSLQLETCPMCRTQIHERVLSESSRSRTASDSAEDQSADKDT